MAQYGPISCFSPVSLTGMVRQKLGVGKWEKMGVLAIQKVAKTGNFGKKLQWQAISIM